MTGTGFRDMGAAPEKGLVRVLSTNHFDSGATIMPARLLSADRLVCDILPSVTADPIVDSFGARRASSGRRHPPSSLSMCAYHVCDLHVEARARILWGTAGVM